MVYKRNKSLSDSDIREEESVDFIRDLLKGHGVKPALKKGDKEANIDGYIELLDDENRINGKITAQVKTVPPSLEGQFLYDCPTSLFGYAEQTSEVVLIMAVDHKNQVVLWKYISRELLDANVDKCDQDTIRLHFNQDERMTSANVEETITIWRDITRQQLKLYNDAPALVQENELLRKALLEAKGIDITLTKEELGQVQLFVDKYNDLMNHELQFVKKILYPNVWKFGIAIYRYEENELGYLVYSIHSDETAPLIKQMPQDFALLQQMPYEVMSNYNCENPLKKDYRLLVRDRIKYHIEKFLHVYNTTPMTVPFAMERVNRYLNSDKEGWVIPLEERECFSRMGDWLTANVSHLLQPNTRVVYGFMNEADMNEIYQSMMYLVTQGYENIKLPYPPKGRYGNTGMVSDWYNPDGAFQKAQYVLNAVNEAYQNFIETNFPLLVKELDRYQGADLLVYDIYYGERQGLKTYCLKAIDAPHSRKSIFSLNGSEPVFRQIEDMPFCDRFKMPFVLDGRQYVVSSMEDSCAYDTLFENAPLEKTYLKRLKDCFEKLPENLI